MFHMKHFNFPFGSVKNERGEIPPLGKIDAKAMPRVMPSQRPNTLL